MGQIKPPFKRGGAPNKPSGKPLGLPKPHRDFLKDPKAQAFWVAAFNAMFGEDNEGEKNDIPSVEDNDTEDTNTEIADDDMRSFLLMVGSLKE